MATWSEIALFDVITNNADRKSGHCLFDKDDNVWVIDHGLTFHVDQKLRRVIWDFAGRELAQEVCGDVERTLIEAERRKLGRWRGTACSRGVSRVWDSVVSQVLA